jgi:uncharacterized Zn finger protein (UPF0148 family)
MKGFHYRTCHKCGNPFYTPSKYGRNICYECNNRTVSLPQINVEDMKRDLKNERKKED